MPMPHQDLGGQLIHRCFGGHEYVKFKFCTNINLGKPVQIVPLNAIAMSRSGRQLIHRWCS
jgi:hypothetical protein